MVKGRVKTVRQVALSAQGIAGRLQREAVRIVTVAARDPLAVHAALEERAVDVDLLEDLPVGVVEPLVEEPWPVRVEQ